MRTLATLFLVGLVVSVGISQTNKTKPKPTNGKSKPATTAANRPKVVQTTKSASSKSKTGPPIKAKATAQKAGNVKAVVSRPKQPVSGAKTTAKKPGTTAS